MMSALATMRRRLAGCGRTPAVPGNAAGFRVLPEKRRDHGAITAPNGAGPLRRLAPAACVLLALAGLWPAAAQAQTVAYVGNVNQRATSTSAYITSPLARAQMFGTGSRSGGYPFQDVVLRLGNIGTGTLTVTIRESTTENLPSSNVLYRLTNPASLVSGLNTFTAPPGATLQPRTFYFIVAQSSRGNAASWSRTRNIDDVDDGGADGWDITFPYLTERLNGTWWEEDRNSAFMARIRGEALPPPPPTLVSNLESEDAGATTTVFSRRNVSQPFWTGSVAGGYTLDGIALHFNGSGAIDSGALTVTLRAEGEASRPGRLLHTLTNPSTVNPAGLNEFTAPEGVVLAADTQYHVVLENSSGNLRWSRALFGVDPGSEADWRIPGRHFQQNDGGLWEFNSRAHVMAVRGSEAPLSTVTVTRVASTVNEGEDAQFTVRRTEATAGALTVLYWVSTTGDVIASGEEGAKTVVFGDGDTEVTVTVPTVQDSDDEAYGEVRLVLTDHDAYNLGFPRVAVVTVEDDDDVPLPTGQSALVSNLERFEGRFGETAFATQILAQPFRTGSAARGYTLQGMALRLDWEVDEIIDRRDVTVTLRESAADGRPGDLLYTLTTPSSVNAGVNEFTAPAGAFLAADTRYHVVLEYSTFFGFIRWALARTGEDSGAAAGWTIPSTRYRQRGSGSWSSISLSAQAMAVRGIEAPVPTVSVERVASSVEEGEDAQFRVTRTVTTKGALTVAYSVSESRDMVAASDEGAKTVDFADGVTEVTVTVPTVDDSDDELNSTVTLRLTDDDAYDVGTRSATVTVRDNDEPPTLVSNLDRPSFIIGIDRGVPISRFRTQAQSFRTGSAASGYTLDGIALRFVQIESPAPGRLTVTLRANGSNDRPGDVLHTLTNPSRVEYNEVNEFRARGSVVLAPDTWYHVVAAWNETFGGPRWRRADSGVASGYADGWEIGNRYQQTSSGGSWSSHGSRVLIAVRGAEAPLPTVTVEPVASPVAEGEDAQFKVTRAVTTRGALTVAYNVSETGDVVASDGEGAQSVDLGDGATEVTVTVPTVEDTDHEADSTVTLTLTADAAYELGTDATAEVTVEDDDNAAPTGAPTIDDTTPIVGETLTADTSGIGDADGLTGVTYAWRWLRVASDSTETEVGTGESYTVVAADVGATLKVEVRYTDEDGTEETVESVVTAVANVPPRVTLVLTPDTITEGGTSTLTATLDRASSEDTVVTLQAAGSPLPLPVPLELTIRAGQTESQGDGLMLSPDDDDVDEPDRTLTFSGTAANSEGVTDPDPVTLTIRDNDDTPAVTLRLDPASISEDGEVSTVTASLDHPSSEATTVTVSVTAVAPTTSSDYQLSSNVELTIAAGATDSTGAVTITGVDNSAAAPDKEVTVSATATNAHGITDPDAVTLRIRNDDGVPALSIADASVDEGDSGSTTLDFTVTLDRAATATVTVNWATSDGTATAGTDYTAATGSLTFDAGDSSKTVSVTVTDDDVDEPNETFTVTLAVHSGATIEDGTATGTITDDDATPTVTLTLTPDSISETGGASTVTASLDHPSSQATTVTVTLAPVPPAVAGDYTLSTNRELTIAAGETGSTGVVTITPVNDQVDQPNKRVTVSATATNTLGITAPQDVTLTIRDDENVAPTGAPIINDTTPEAGDTLTADTSGIVDSDGLTGATFRYLWFRVRGGETQVGTGESYTVLDADVGRRLKVVVKYDDDGGTTETVESALTETVTRPSVLPKLTLHLDPASITEAGGTSTVTASLDRGVGREIVLMVEANAVSPATASDFTLSSNRTLRFPPGRTESTRRVTITAVDDAEDAPDKTVTVSAIHSGSSTGASEPEPVTLTIEDDDDPPTGLSIRDAIVDEGDSGDATMTFTVTLSPAATGTVTVDWETAGGTATAGADYTAGNGSLTFDDGDASKEVSVLVTGDNVDEPDETFKVRLSSAVGATIGDAEATGTIRDDDDAPTVTLHLAPASISENGGVSTVTASLDHPSSLGTTVFLSVTPVAPAVAGDYTLSTNLILIIQPGETESTGLVTITAVDNAVDAPSKAVTVSSNLVVNILDANDPEPVTLTIKDDENVAPTGAPTIDDTTPVVGETLTADASGIADPDGLTGATFTWQWVRVSGGTETPITGATTATYTVVAADLGATLKVEATFTDDGGTTETLESAETGTVAAAPPPPPGDRVLVSNTSGDVRGTDSVTPAMAQPFTTGNVSGGYDLSSVVVAINSPGSDVRVTIRESEADGSPGRIVHTLTNPPSDAGGGLHEYSAPAGATLEADTVYHVVAERISGAARRWKLTHSGREDPGAAPGWEIGASFWILDGGTWRSFSSSLQIQVKGTRVNAAPTGAPTIDDTTPVEGETLTADPSGIADADGLTGATFTWQWIRVSGGTETRIAGATTASYTVVAGDVGAKLKVEASFTDDGGTAETVESAATAAVAAFPEVTVASDGDVTEGSAAVFTLTRTGDRAQALDVAYEVTASGRFGVTTGAGTATFPAKDATVQVSLATTGDSTHEAHGSVTVTLQADAAYDLGADAAATATIRDDDDSPATGAVAITGTPTEGETLTADTSGLTDADGLDNAAWAWQWVRTPSGGSDADISGATSQTYVPVFADAGATLKVRVTVTDDEGHEATFTSAPTEAVTALPRPKVTLVLTPDTITEGGTSTVTATLDRASSADTVVTVSVAGSPLPVSLRIRAGQTESQELMFSPHDNDMDEPDRTLTFSGTAANSEGVTDPDPVTLTVRDDDDTPAVTLRLDPASISENGGVSTVTASLDHPSSEATTVTVTVTAVAPATSSDYQLSSNLELTIAAGATDSTGTVTITAVDNAVDAPHKRVTVSATATNTQGITPPQDMTLTVTDDENVAPTGVPAIDDTTPVVGETLTADTSGIGDSDGLTSPTYAYQWIRVASDGTQTPIAGATGATYTVAAADVGATLKVRVTFTDEGGAEETIESAVTAAAQAATLPTVSVERVASSVEEGEDAQFRVTRTGITAGALTVNYDVSETGAMVASGEEGAKTVAFADGESEKTVTVPTEEDTGHEADSTVTLTLTADASYVLGSDATAEVAVEDDDNAAPTGAPTIDDTTPVVGETLTADPSGITDADGLTGATFTWQWIRVSGGTDTPIAGATSETYTVVAADIGSTLKVETSFTDDDGTTETVESAATPVVEAPPPAIFDASRSYGVITRYRQTTTVDLAEYLATGVASSAVTFAVDDCGPTSSDFYRSVTLSGGTLSLVSNELGHTHGDRTEMATECVVTATMGGESEMRTFSFRIVPPRALITVQTPAVSVVGRYENALEVQVRDPSGLGRSWLRLAWRKTGTSAWENRIMSGAALGSSNPPVIRIEGLESATTYTVQAVVLTREAFDYYANGRAIAERVLTELASGLDGKWIANMVGGGQSRAGRAEGTTTTVEPTFLRASVNGIVLTVTMNKVLDEASVPAASAFTVSDVGGVGMRRLSGVAVSGSDVTLTVSPSVGADEAVTVSYAVPGSAVLQDVDGNAAAAFTDQPVANETPTVTLVLTPDTIGENGGVSTVTATLDKPSSQVATVTLAATPVSPAVAGDFTLSGSRLTIAANSLTSTGTVTITANDNDVDAPDKTVTVSATVTNTQGVSGPDDTTLTIEDDEATPAVTLVLTPASIGENGGVSTVTATLDHPSSQATTVTVSAAPESPAVAADYTLSGSRLTIAAGETTSTGTVTITAVNNPVHEGDKTVTVSATATNSYGITAPRDVELTIEEDEVLPVVSIDDASVDEGDSGSTTLEFTVRLDRTAREPARVDWATADGTATAGTDYRAETGTLMFAGGDSSKTVTVSVLGDEVDEPNETFTVTLSNPSSVALGDDTATGTITDDDDTPTVTLNLSPNPIGENGGTSTVTATLNHPSSAATTVTVTATPESPATTSDYTLSSDLELRIAAGSTTSTDTVTITAVDNAVHASDKTVTVSATAVNAQGITAPQDVRLTIRDDENVAPTGAPTIDDTTPVVGETLTADPSGIGDADGLTGATFTWQWVRVSGGTDTPIAGATTASYTVVAGDVGATLKVVASFTDDGGTAETVESAETAVVEALPEVTVASDGDVTEGSDAVFTLTRTGDTAGTLDVDYEVTASGDFGVATGAATASFPANSATVQVSVPTTDDTAHEAHGSVTVTLQAGAAYTLGTDAAATAAIRDDENVAPTGAPTIDDTTPVVGETLTANPSGIDDPDGLTNRSFTWQWIRVSGGTGTPIAGATTASYTVVAGDVGATLKVEASFTDDGGTAETVESAETSVVEAAPLPTVAVTRVASPVQEGTGAQFRVTRTVTTTGALTVRYSVSETGEMVASGDEGAKTVDFADGDTERTVTVPTVADTTHEAHSTVTLTLTADAAWDLGTATAEVTVEDDDDSPATGTVTITGTPTEFETLTADTSDISDADGLDNAAYAWQWIRTPSGGSDADISGATSRTYTLNTLDVGATLKVRVTVTDDEGHQATFTSAPTAAVAALPRPEITVASDGDVTEGSPALFTLTRTGDTAEILDVIYEVTATGDFGVTPGTVTASFPANSATVQVSVATTGDGTHEAHGSVTVTLQAGASYTLGADAAATAAVRDDDNAAPTGAVTIDDTTPVVGETLTADASGIDDPDGLTNRSFTWQWVRVSGGTDTPIAGATAASYKVVDADVGATLKVEVSFTDDDGTNETVESDETAAATKPVVTVASDGDVTEGSPAVFTLTRTGSTAETLDVAYDVAATAGFGVTTGAATATFPASSSTVQVSLATTGDTTHEAHGSVTVTLTAVQADAAYVLGTDAAATAAVRDDDNAGPTGEVTIDDTTPVVGETLTADASDLGDPDGLTNRSFTYQWVRVSSGTGTRIAGATAASYTVVDADVGATLKVEVGFTDDDGTNETVESDETETVLDNDDSPTTGEVTITGTPTEGETLTADTSGLADADGLTGATYTYQWVRTPAGGSDTDISGATSETYTPVFRDAGATLKVRVTVTDDRGFQATLTSAPTAAVAALPRPVVTVASDGDVTEGSPALFTLTRTGDTAEVLDVAYDVTTSGDFGVTTVSGTASFPANGATAQVSLATTGDATDEADGSVTLTLQANPIAYTLGADDAATAAVADDDTAPTVTLMLSSRSIAESGGVSTVTATLDHPSSEETTVTVSVTPQSSATTSDYTPSSNLELRIAAGDTTSTGTVTITAVDNAVHGPDKTVTVSATAVNALEITAPQDVTLTITDDDNAAPTGAPTIDDTTPVVGETLTADPSGIDDPDGLTNRSFTWRWLRVSGGTDTPIAGATSETYTVAAGDVGSTLKVEASFTDDDGTAETVESAATAAAAAAPLPTVSVEPVASPVAEGAGAQFRVKRTVVTAGALTVRYRVSETGAMVASGEEGAKSVAFADGDTEKTVTVPTVEDTGHEADSTVTVTLTADAAYDVGTGTADVTVTDDDNAAPTGAPTIDDTTPVVGETLTADPSGIGDADGLTGATFTWRWLRVASGGTETEVGTGESYTVAAGDVGSTLKVEASFTDDDGTAETVESAETATVALPMLSIGDASVDEGDSGSVTLNFTVTLSHTATDTVTVEWATADGTATAGTDYTAGSGRLTFNTGDSSRTVFVTVASDDVDEPDETFTVMLSNPSGATIEDGAATGTIRDGDDEPKVTLIVTPNPLHENGGVSTVTARLDRASSEATTVTVSVTPVAPTVEDNYEVSDNLELRIAAGATTSTGRVTITGVNNREHSPNKEISVSGTAVNSQGVTDPDPVTLALFDDDGPPSVTLHLTPDSITENGGLSTVTARQSRRSGADTTITVSAAPVAPAVAGDYTLSADLVLTVAAGETESTGTVTVTAVNNSVYEGDKQVTVSGTAENALGILGDPRDVTLTITDDENPPLELSIGDASVDEGDSGSTTLDFTVTLDRTATETVTVDWETSDGTATAGTDYTAGNGTLTFSIGDSSKTVSVTVAGDNVDEPNETFTVTLSNASSGATIGDGTATGTITDDDATPKVTLLLSPDTIDEDGGTATLTASLDRPSSEDTTVEGIGGVNFEAFYTVGPGPNPVLTIPAGETASTGTVTLTAVANNVDAPDRRITVSAEASNGLGVTSPDNVTLTIEDDDDAPTVTLHLSPETISEAGGTSSATASLSHPSGVETTVTVTVVPVSPAVAGDYRLSSNVVLTIVAGEMDSTGTVTVTAVDNDVDAPDKEVTVWATTANAHSGSVLDSAPLTIEDDDATPTVTLVLTPNSVAEAGGTSTVTASLDRTSSEVTTVTVSASPVPPAVASDYTLSANLELTIAAGATESEGLVTITAVDNDMEVPDRTVTVSGTAMNDHEVTGPRDVTLTIADDDGRELSIDDADVAEGGSGDSATLEFTVTLTPAATVEVTVDWETADGTAQAGTDYTAGSGRLTFGAGETGKTVSVPVAGNGVDEPDKTVTVTLSNASGAVLGDATGTGTIVDDDDTPTVTLVLTPASIVENGGVSTVTARLNRPSSEATTVTVTAAPMTPAVAGDYTLSGSRLTIAAGATTSTGEVTVTGVDNDVEAPDRRVTVSGTATNGQGVTGPRDVTLTIVDDESVDERHRRLEYALASFGRTVAQDLVTVIEDREWLASAGTTATLAGTPLVSFRSEEAVYGALQRYVGPDGDRVGTAALRELLSRSSFQLSLGDEGAGEAGGPRAGSLVLWGRGSQSWSRGRLDAAVATRGEMLSGQVGLEYRLREDMLLGVMVNASNGALDFDEALATEVEAELVSVHPYAQWSPGQGLRGWAMLGYGVGEAALADSFSALTGTDIETDIEMVMAAAGGSHEVASRWGFDWSLGTNGFLVQLDADEREGLPAAVQSEVWQMRLLLEGSAGEDFGGVSGLSGNVELAARVDGGDAETGLGMELGGGVAYGHLNLGIDVKASGRVLLSHEDGLEDAGMSLALEVDPGERGRGLYFALAPSWGNTTSGARAMWEDRQASTGVPHGSDGRLFDPTMWLDSELGYTAPLPTHRGALTSYGAFSSYGGAARQYRIGRRLELADLLSMSFEAERRESAGVAPEHSIWLKSSIRF